MPLKLDIAFPVFLDAFGNQTLALDARNDVLNYIKRPDTISYSTLVTLVAKKEALV